MELMRLRQVQEGDAKPKNTQQLVLNAKKGSEEIEILQQTSNSKKIQCYFKEKKGKENSDASRKRF